MSSLAPTPPPETGDEGGGDGGLPLSPPAPSPENDDIIPPPAPVFPILPPLLPPPLTVGPVAAPPLPLIVIGATPPPTSPILSPPPSTLSPSPPQPQPQPQPPLASPPPPITKNKPPQETPTPPSISPPVNPSTPASASPPPQQPPRRPKTPPVTKPSPIQRGPSKPKVTTPSSPPPSSTLPTSAVLPSPPPVALPVPQAPDGGAWLPFTPGSPSPLPIFPGPPAGVISSPAAPLTNGIPSAFAPSDSAADADHQNIEAANAASSSGRSNGSSGFVVGLCVAGVLLLLLGVVFSILAFFCRRREKKFADYGSGSKHGTSFNGFEDKTSLSQYTKQDSNTSGHQVLTNVATSQGPNFSTSGSAMVNVGPIAGVGIALCNGTFTYEELAGATDGFSDRNLLGQGGFGYVHKGVLPNGKEVAVKQLKMGGHQGEREFRAEVETISQVHHKHLVSLVGYCIAGAERLLVYEFVRNNTLEFHLHGKGQPVMDWPTRLKIAIGSAKGLAYLHEDCNPTIIHRDIKASNILLDYNFEAKVSDFGLAKIFTSGSSVTHMTTRVVGTFGYLAPEYASSGKVTDKSDVYSYGVMLLELITGRPPISNFQSSTNGSLVNWARPLLTQAIGDGKFESLADPRLKENYDVDEMASMVACAAACVRLSAWRRPRMSQVVHALEGNLPLSELDDGTRPGHSAMHFPYESLDFDAHNCMENMKRMAMTSNVSGYTTNRYSENTSEYGLHPSASSTDTN